MHTLNVKRTLLAAMIFAFVAGATAASRPSSTPSQAAMIGVWSGYDDQSEFVRVELKADGSGSLALLSAGKKLTYYIPKWHWNSAKSKLDFTLRQTKTADAMWLRIKSATAHKIEMSCGSKGSSREVIIFKEPKH